MTNTHALSKAIACFGSQKAMAASLYVVPMAISMWKRRGFVPVGQCLAIERATGGAVKCHELRPDKFPVPDEAAA